MSRRRARGAWRAALLAGGAALLLAAALLALTGRGAEAQADADSPAGSNSPPDVDSTDIDPDHTSTAVAPAGTTGPQAAAAQAAADDDPAMVAAGEELFLTACVNCHGVGGVGTPGYPSLIGVGAASADFYLRTGRMPLAFPSAQTPEKPPVYDDEQIRQLVAYVASLGDGPPVPDVDTSRGDLVEGGQLFLSNCAPCHNSAGAGGALSNGRHAPDLMSVHPTQVGEAVRVGPGDMPVFGTDTFTDEQIDSIARYIDYLQAPEHPGGLRIGGIGPVPEGFVAWLVGLGALLLIARWITRERHVRRPR